MSKVTDGGAAFPDPGRAQSAKQREVLTDTGMTLRDYFAAKAVQAQLTAFWAMETHHGWSHDEIAREAYAMADAMIVARGET